MDVTNRVVSIFINLFWGIMSFAEDKHSEGASRNTPCPRTPYHQFKDKPKYESFPRGHAYASSAKLAQYGFSLVDYSTSTP